MSTLLNPQNAPRDVEGLRRVSQAILFRLGMQLNLFNGDEPQEQAFFTSDHEHKVQVLHEALKAYDLNPHAAAARSMAAPGAAPPGVNPQMSYPPAPPGAAAPPAQAPLPYPPQPPAPGFAPPNSGYPPAASPYPPAPPPPAPAAPPPAPPGGGWPTPPGTGTYMAPPGAAMPPPAPPGAPQGYGAAPGYPTPQPPPAPPAPPAGGQNWTVPGAPAAATGYPPIPGAPAPAYQPAPAPGYPPQPPAQPVAAAPPPVRAPQTPSDPSNQGAAGHLLAAIQTLTTEIQNQNRLLAGLGTLVETNFIATVLLADRMQIPRDQFAYQLSAEREKITQQFLRPPQGK